MKFTDSMKNIVLVFLILINSLSCSKDPCKGEPHAICFDNSVYLRLLNSDKISIFENRYDIDSLIVKENDSTLMYTYTDQEEIKIQLYTFRSDNVTKNFNKVIESKLILSFNSNSTDTMLFRAKPMIYPDNCNSTEYVSYQVLYNDSLILTSSQHKGFLCGNQLEILIK